MDVLSPGKGRPDQLIADLAFAFFGHQQEFNENKGDIKEIQRRYKGRVVEIVEFIYLNIQSEQFSKDRLAFIDAKYLADFFNGKRFSYLKKLFATGSIDFSKKKNRIQRGVFFAIFSIAYDIFHWKAKDQLTSQLREMVGYQADPSNKTDVSDQVKTLRMLIDHINDFTTKNPPDWSITYGGDYNRPTIKTDQSGRFLPAHDARRDGEVLSGRYTIFRKAFTPPDSTKVYMRESLTIRLRGYGVTFELNSINAEHGHVSKFQGVAMFLDNAFWLMGHTSEVYPRIRMVSGSTSEWRQMKNDPNSLSAILAIQTHVKRLNAVLPVQAMAMCKTQTKNNPNSPYFDAAEFLSKEELRKYLTEFEADYIMSMPENVH